MAEKTKKTGKRVKTNQNSGQIFSRILSLIGLGPVQLQYHELPQEIQMHVRKNQMIDAGLIILSLMTLLISRKLVWFSFALIIALISVLYHMYCTLLFLCGKILYLDGEVKDIRPTFDVMSFITKKPSKTGPMKIELKAEKETFIITAPITKAKEFREGNVLMVYTAQNGIIPQDPDTYTVPSPIIITKIRNGDPSRDGKNDGDNNPEN